MNHCSTATAFNTHPMLPPQHRAFVPVIARIAALLSEPDGIEAAARYCRVQANNIRVRHEECEERFLDWMVALHLSAFDIAEFVAWLEARADDLEASQAEAA